MKWVDGTEFQKKIDIALSASKTLVIIVLFKCEHDVISDFRNKFIPSYYCKNPNVQKNGGMFSNCHIQLLTNIAY